MKRKILACLMATMMVIGLLPANAVAYETGNEGNDARRFDSQNVMISPNHDTVLAAAAETPEGGENTPIAVPAGKLIFKNAQIAITSWTPRGKNLAHGWSRRIYP